MQTVKTIVAVMLVTMIGTIASCTFMGGVIRYLVEAPIAASASS